MATKRITREMADIAAKALCRPIYETVKKIEKDIDNKIIEFYYSVPMYRELEKVREKYPKHIMVTRRVMLTAGALIKQYDLTTPARVISNGFHCELKCGGEFINDVDLMQRELLRHRESYFQLKNSFEESIYETGTLANLKKTIPEAYEKIAEYENDPVGPKEKGPFKAKKEVDLKPLFKRLKQYENRD